MKKILIIFIVFVSLFSISGKALAFLIVQPFSYGAPANTSKYDYSESISAIDDFLDDPTFENLKSFCTLSKTIILPGYAGEEILNAERTDFTREEMTLYKFVNSEQSQEQMCSKVLGENPREREEWRSFYGWMIYDPALFLNFENQNESDLVRENKIRCNTSWKNLSAYKLIGFGNQGQIGVTPDKLIEQGFSCQSLNFLLPEKVLLNIRKLLVANNISSIQPQQNIISSVPPVTNNSLVNNMVLPINSTAINNTLQNTISAIPKANLVKQIVQSKTTIQKEETKKEIQKTPDDSLTISDTLVVPQRLSWWRRIINWIFK